MRRAPSTATPRGLRTSFERGTASFDASARATHRVDHVHGTDCQVTRDDRSRRRVDTDAIRQPCPGIPAGRQHRTRARSEIHGDHGAVARNERAIARDVGHDSVRIHERLPSVGHRGPGQDCARPSVRLTATSALSPKSVTSARLRSRSIANVCGISNETPLCDALPDSTVRGAGTERNGVYGLAL